MPASKPAVLLIGSLCAVVVVAFAVYAYLAMQPPLPPGDRTIAGTTVDAASAAMIPPIRMTSRPIGEPMHDRPWITHLVIRDLDQDGLADVLVCDAQSNSVQWIRQESRGVFVEQQIGGSVAAPAHVDTCDIDRDGDLDLLVAGMGVIFPNNDPIGAVVVIENLGGGQWRNRTLVERIARVTDVRGSDFDADGDIDLVVGQFGYDQGEIRWMENKGGWDFSSKRLLSLSGTIHTPAADLDGDERPDFAALVSQEWEEVHVFRNLGGGQFRGAPVWGSTNEDYGSSGLEIADIDSDGDPDLLYTNGDAFDYARPGPRPWHGIQWLENRGGTFAFHRVGDFPGAYSPVCADLNGDGHNDLVAVSGFNFWDKPEVDTLMAWLNDGTGRFLPAPLAQTPTHLMALAAGDLDDDGRPELVTGGFHAYPPWDRMSRVLLWTRE